MAEEESQPTVPEEDKEEEEQEVEPSAPPSAPATYHPPKTMADPRHIDYLNGQLHAALVSGDYADCKAIAAEVERETEGRNVYAKFVRGTIAREEGDLDEAQRWFDEAVRLSPNNTQYAVQLGRAHFLAGRHVDAVEILQKAMHRNADATCCFWLAWSLYYAGRGQPQTLEKVKDVLTLAPNLNTHRELLRLLARVLIEMGDKQSAVPVYKRIIEIEPESSANYVALGHLLCDIGQETEGFAALGQALGYQSNNPEALLAVGYVMQMHGDHDVALNKYKVSAASHEYDGCLWNNIGMCFYSKGKFVSCISCLKKAAYLSPLEPKIFFNLGLAHVSMNQFASAYHFVSAALALQPNDPDILALLAVVLSKMNDSVNARKAYKKALEHAPPKAQTVLNYAIFEFEQREYKEAAAAIVTMKSLQRDMADNLQMEMEGIADRLGNLILDRVQEEKEKRDGDQHPPDPVPAQEE